MFKPKSVFLVAGLLFICLLSASATSAQQQSPEQSFEAVLHVLSASNNAAGDASTAAPPSLAKVVSKLKTNYTFSNFRITSTFIQRIANSGNMEFKDVSNEVNRDALAPIFSEWTLVRLFSTPDARGQESVSIQNFKFGQRVPVKVASIGAQNGKSAPEINYENVGLSMNRLSLPLNVPTIIGNLYSSKPDELSFLVLTVKPVD